MLTQLFLAAEAAGAAVEKAAEKVGGGGTQEAIDHALWQYPVAALVIAVVVLFLRYMKKEREAQQAFLSDTNKLDREDREKAQKRFTDSLLAVQHTHDETTKDAVESFKTGLTQVTSQQNALMARAIDTIDRNTEAFGEVKALVEITKNHRSYRDDEEEEEEVEVRVVKKKRPKKKKKKPKPEPEPEPEEDEEEEDEEEEDEE